jgi:dissimilatory sulfite reductase (desulfoviridin) alpha/beta subunit
MEWDSGARAMLGEVPSLLRGFVTKKVEEYASKRGANRVTVEIWDAAKQLRQPSAPPAGANAGHGHGEGGGHGGGDLPPADVLASLVQMAEAKGQREGKNYRLRMCGGAFGCPRPAVQVGQLSSDLEAELGHSGHLERLTDALGDRILTHHKMAMGVCGCINGCSEPQTKDFSVVGQLRPDAAPGKCTGCGRCEKACQESAVRAGTPRAGSPDPAFDRKACLNCGDCAKVCATGAIKLTPGYRIMVGGKLGRHPRLADVLVPFTEHRDQVLTAFRTVLAWSAEVGRPGERLGVLLERHGIEPLRDRLKGEMDKASR